MKNEESDTGGGKRKKLPPVKGYTAKDDVKAVMKQYNLSERFPKVVLDGVKRVEWSGERLDLRKKFIFTCDPVTAKDFDDALPIEKDRKGNRILGVHIVDVSHCVTPGSALLEERADEAERSLHEVKRFRFLEGNGGVFDAVAGCVEMS